MADASVRLQDVVGAQFRVDNESVTNGAGETVYQQRVVARNRDEHVDFLYFDAGGVTSVGINDWVALAAITVPDGRTLRLINAEGDLADLSSIGNTRAIRIRKAGTVIAAALTGADQPNPDIVALTLTNSSGGNETWDLQGRHNAVGSRDMVGWFSWVDVT